MGYSTIVSWIGIFVFCFSIDSSKAQFEKKDFPHWVETVSEFACTQLLKNIGPLNTNPGAVIASPSKKDPNYYYHWIRDAALVMDVVTTLYQNEQDPIKKETLYSKLKAYVHFSQDNQKTKTLTGLGEPKFEVDGRPFDDPKWGRPQNDGPALRTVALLRFRQTLGASNSIEALDLNRRIEQVIERDVDYILSHWNIPTYDLWEEVQAIHFYTLMVQRKALLKSAGYFSSKDNIEKVSAITAAILGIEKELETFVDSQKQIILAYKDRTGGYAHRVSRLDVSTILATLHGGGHHRSFSVDRPELEETAKELEKAFYALYPINRTFSDHSMGSAIGRYPEDFYSGIDSEPGGHPWVLATLGLAEFYYKLASKKHEPIYYKKGERLLKRVWFHSPLSGELAEQMDKKTGFMRAAENLTWNYAAILTTLSARKQAYIDIHKKGF
ncbi:MAG: glycoside hydrolase family 15 protein [Bacteriovoracia bacterium]